MTSVESVKNYEAAHNDAKCQEMYEPAMWKLSAEGMQLQKEYGNLW